MNLRPRNREGRVRDHQEDEEISEVHHSPPQEEEDDVDSVQSHSSQSRGRPRIIESWTRVVSLKHDDLE